MPQVSNNPNDPSNQGNGANPFMDGPNVGYNSSDIYGGGTGDGTSFKGWSQGTDLTHGTQRSDAIANYSQYLMGRQGPQFTGQSNYGLSQARGEQVQSNNLMGQFAAGNGPSVAQAQTYGALGNNMASMNAASQGRGGAPNAMVAGGQLGQQAANQGGMARSQEQNGLMSAYSQGAGQLSAGDIAQYGTDTQQYERARQLAAQQGILNAQTTFGIQGQEEQNEINRESFQQATGQLDIKAKQQAAQAAMAGIGTGIGVLTTAALAGG